jgi:hypothetical protein
MPSIARGSRRARAQGLANNPTPKPHQLALLSGGPAGGGRGHGRAQGVGDPILLGPLIDGHKQLAIRLLVDRAARKGIDQVKPLASLPLTGTKGHRLRLRF